MILYTKDGGKVKCIKLKQPPKINSKMIIGIILREISMTRKQSSGLL